MHAPVSDSWFLLSDENVSLKRRHDKCHMNLFLNWEKNMNIITNFMKDYIDMLLLISYNNYYFIYWIK